jgi:DNA-binding transcriptional LysR family regulator
MELRQLEYFVAVAEEANFTRAAERVHISQSGVSAQIRQLELELGAILLDRSGRTTTLTAAGAAALEHARTVLASVTAVQQAVDDVTGLVRGRLVVGMVTGCTISTLFEALAEFHLAHPGVEVSLFEDNSDRLIDGVRTGTIDLALIGAAGAPPADLAALTIVSEPIVALVPPGHPLAKRRRATLATITAHPIVCLPDGTGIRAVFDQACTAKGLRPNIVLQATAPAAVAELALRGFGVGILSESITANHDEPLCAIAISDVDTPALLALTWATRSNPALRELLRHTNRAFTGPGAETANTKRASRRTPSRLG